MGFESNELITIIVPIYNTETYLRCCIDSILRQTYKNLEIILVDDGSTDSSADICEYYSKSDNRITVIHKQNAGLVEARRTGVNAAHGKYIGYVDSDDWIDPNMYENLYQTAKKYNAQIVCAGRIVEYDTYTVVEYNRMQEGVYHGDKKSNLIYNLFPDESGEFGVFPTLWDKLFDRKLLIENQNNVPSEISIGEDVACSFPCMVEADTIVILHDSFYHYRQREGSMLRTGYFCGWNQTVTMASYLRKRFMDSGYYSLLEKQIDNYIYQMGCGAIRVELSLNSIYYAADRYIFPFWKINESDEIILYGFGHVGKLFFWQIYKSKCITVRGIIDRKHAGTIYYGYRIEDDSCVQNRMNQKIVIAVSNEMQASQIKDNMKKKGIAEDSIIWDDYRY